MSERSGSYGHEPASDPLAFAADLAARTGALLLEYFRSERLQTGVKDDFSPVTEADLAADRLIADALAAEFPDDAVLSEELAPRYDEAARAVWVVDPLDGTTNFALGLQHWGVSIARVVGGVPDLAALYFPVIDELYEARRGGGAFLNGRALGSRRGGAARPRGVLACCSRTHRFYNFNVPFKTRIFGSAAYSLVSVARGSAALALETTPKVWDVAAATLVVREAGGLVETVEGDEPFPLRTGPTYAEASFPTLAAATPELLAMARDHLERR